MIDLEDNNEPGIALHIGNESSLPFPPSLSSTTVLTVKGSFAALFGAPLTAPVRCGKTSYKRERKRPETRFFMQAGKFVQKP